MVLSEVDRNLLRRCLDRQPRSWEDFVDRFLGLVVHVINHTCQARAIKLSAADRDDLVAEVMLALIDDDFKLLRRFRGESSLATYLTVVSRRIVVRELLKRKSNAVSLTEFREGNGHHAGNGNHSAEDRIVDREEVERLMRSLEGAEADVVRLYHLEGKSYHEISAQVGMPENSVGPMLSRARAKMRRSGSETASP
ncbi:MAG: sigma-70 family RNA polymerase sigma factor [Pirellulaceae bacterium]|nr:sigma-70 family RNA polymerase sigma factor [Planctomycetales bacterium]MCA9203750.1 sigma-70 family RNA polymerase sigma factor [Planctomycetales bacterium]MCA9208178.1 sigma-70 family RNA polymerase sigma factor [Planctomycetales bacterium]MCA9223203.1 sigma-70 family RNA polymerase sigma factor [Planctomycetales bacterium]MCA9224631.1 sigma-70 family RNA polymerase sigma factor [Planctomycetales bacterium]